MLFSDPVETLQRRRAEGRERSAREDEDRLDELLKRIHDEGIQSLSRREKEFLKRVSSRR